MFSPRYKSPVLCLLAVLAGLLLACASSEPTALVPPPAGTAGTTVVAGPGPAETRDPFATFTQNLQTAIDKNDDPALKPLIGVPWLSGRYQTELTEYRETSDAVAAFRALRQRATITLDQTLAGTHPGGTPKIGERIIVSRWLNNNGKEEPAFLYASVINGGWRWTGFLIGVPVELVSAQPSPTPAIVLAPLTPAAPATVVAAATTTAGTPTLLPTRAPLSGHWVFAQAGKLAMRDIKGNAESPVLPLPGATLEGEWNHDGTRAVFLTGTAAQAQLYTVRPNGSGLTKIGTPGRYTTPRWSPDGTVILYTVIVAANRSEIWAIGADGTQRRKLIDGYDAAWAPDGQRIAFASNPATSSGGRPAQNGIHLVNAQGKNEWAPMTTDTVSPKFTPLEWQLSQAHIVDNPQWSPDGKELTLRAQNGHGAYVTTGSSSGGFGKFIAVYFDASAHGFSYSPNGVYIALGSGGQSGFETIAVYRRSDIGKDGISGSPLRTLGRTPQANGESGQSVSDYVWSPDGSYILYAIEKGGVWLMDIGSGAATQISADGSAPVYWPP